VQVYTAVAYAGPTLIHRLMTELAAALRAAGFARVEDAIGCQAAGRSIMMEIPDHLADCRIGRAARSLWAAGGRRPCTGYDSITQTA